MDIRTNLSIAVVGAGTMGAGIAQVAAAAGHPVIMIDQNEAALERGRAAMMKNLESAVGRGRLDAPGRDAVAARIRWSSDLALVADAALVIEAVVERIDIKRSLIAAIACVTSHDTLIASNTSSFAIADLAGVLVRPERLLGLHFFNPVPAMELVEVVAGPATDAATIEAACALMRAWGKRPVVVRDVPGFIVNQVARPYYAEAFIALEEGFAPEVIDAALSGAGGFRMGPLALADMIGHDINFAVAVSVYDAYSGRTRFRPQPAQRALVEAGRLGRKSGRGVYDHGNPLTQPIHAGDARIPTTIPITIFVSTTDLLTPLVDAARDHGITVTEEAGLGVDIIRLEDIVMALGDGRSLAQRPDVDILLDHARDFTNVTTCIVTVRSNASMVLVRGFLEAIERHVLQIPDRPGQIVLRMLAQLANAAADAARNAVASIDGIDEAMVFGANHPEGPLAWAERIGHARVHAALAHIAAETGDPIYAPSPFFRPHDPARPEQE